MARPRWMARRSAPTGVATTGRTDTAPVATRPAARGEGRVLGWEPPFFYGWVLAGVGFTANMLNGALLFHAFGTYVVLLRDEFGWSKTSFSLAFALMRVESGLLGPIEGWAVDRFGPRSIMTLGTLIFGLGLMSLSLVNSLLTFYLVFLMMALGSALGAFLPISVALVNWFDRRRALALSFLSLGFSAGGLILPVVVFGLETLGWREMSFVAGIIVLLVGLPMAQLVRHRPEDHGYHPDGATDEEVMQQRAAGRREVNFTARQALRTSSFWMISLGASASLLVFGAVAVHFQSHLKESMGLSLGTAAFATTVMTLMMIIAQAIFGGFLGDRVNKQRVIVIAMFGHTVALLFLAFGTNLWAVMAFAVINGLAMGTRGPLMQAMRADYFGRESFGTIMGFSSLVMMFGIVTGPLLAGLSFDVLGDYRPAFVLLALLSALGSVFFMLARPPTPPAQGGRATAGSEPALAPGTVTV
ncbi:MAG: MFS transporter [Dehalococcoidia bacterium]